MVYVEVRQESLVEDSFGVDESASSIVCVEQERVSRPKGGEGAYTRDSVPV